MITPTILAFALRQADAVRRISKFNNHEGDCEFVSVAALSYEGSQEQRRTFGKELQTQMGSKIAGPLCFNFDKTDVYAWVTWSNGLEYPLDELGCQDVTASLSYIGETINAKIQGEGTASAVVFEDVPTEYNGDEIDGIDNIKLFGGGSAFHGDFTEIAERLGWNNDEEPEEKATTIPEWMLEAVFDPEAEDKEKDEPLLLSGGIPWIYPHDFVLLTAAKKSGKSTLLSAIVAAAASDAEVLSFSRPEGQEPLKVLWADTEQQKTDILEKTTLLYKLAGGASVNVRILSLLKFQTTERIKMIREWMKVELPDILVIDGIVDLLESRNFNDAETSVSLIDSIKHWCASGPAVIGIIHSNSSTLAADKSQGHLGSEAERRGEVLMRLDVKASGVRTLRFGGRHTQRPGDFNFILDENGMHIVTENESRTSTSWSDFAWSDYLEPGRKYSRIYLADVLRKFKPDIKDSYVRMRISQDTTDGAIVKSGDSYCLRE